MKKVLTSFALAGALGIALVGCGGEPRSVEELSKLSEEELNKMFETCQEKLRNKEFDNDQDKVQKNEKELLSEYLIMNWELVSDIKNTSPYSKEFIECGRVYKAGKSK